MWLIGLFILGAIIFLSLIAVLTVVSVMVRRNGILRQHRREMAKTPALTQEQWIVLQEKVAYYQHLSAENRRRFEHRLVEVLSNKHFILHEVDAPSDVVKVILGSTLVQLSFGLHAYTLPGFPHIHVVGRKLRKQNSADTLAAHMDQSAGTLTFSWPDVSLGNADPGDGISVALQALGMALYRQNFMPGKEAGFFAKSLRAQWQEAAKETFARIRAGDQQLFRVGVVENHTLLFSEGLALFFEQPVAFSQQLASLYHAYCSLLNQDPRKQDDPVISLRSALEG